MTEMHILCLNCARELHEECEQWIYLGDASGNAITMRCECNCDPELNCKPSLCVIEGGRA